MNTIDIFSDYFDQNTSSGWDEAGDSYGDIFLYNVELKKDMGSLKKGDIVSVFIFYGYGIIEFYREDSEEPAVSKNFKINILD